MCKEDIRIGRKRVYDKAQYIVNTGGIPMILAPRPDRVAVVISADDSLLRADNNGVYICDSPGITGGFAMEYNPYNSPLLLRVEDYGDFVTGAMYIYNGTATSYRIMVMDIYLTQPLEGL